MANQASDPHPGAVLPFPGFDSVTGSGRVYPVDITDLVMQYPEVQVVWAARDSGPPAVYRRRGRRRELIVDPRLEEPDRRHALGHEMGHFLMDTDHWAQGDASTEEHAADRIADLLLVPTERLRRFLIDCPGATPGDIASAFRVPTATAERRIQELPR